MAKFDYKKAEADLYDVGAHHPDEIYDYKSEKAIRGYMKENGLNPDKYYKPDGKNSHSKPGSNKPCAMVTGRPEGPTSGSDPLLGNETAQCSCTGLHQPPALCDAPTAHNSVNAFHAI